MRKTVVLSILGSRLDHGVGPKRWNRWRPTVDLCRHEDFVVDRLELLVQRRMTALAQQLTDDVRSISPTTEIRSHNVEFDDPWEFEGVYASLLDFTRRLTFRPDREDYLVHISTGTHVAQICWFLLTEARFIPGQLLQTSPGAGNTGPGTYRIIDLDLSKYDTIRSRFAADQSEALSFLKAGIDTKNAAFNRLMERIETVVTRTSAPLLLTGATGVGKTRLARRIFELKAKRGLVDGGFVEVNCATLRGDHGMSTLFGHNKGAFTGATRDRTGVLAQADKGVLFLDEIGELGHETQAMLLHALEDGRFTPLGAEREVHSAFQLIAGTNRDLRAAVAAGRFREDLLARIDLWSFELPGLRSRPEDIVPNLEYELDRFARARGRRPTLTRDARSAFLTFATSDAAIWAGNFRDFAGAVERMATLASGHRISVANAREEIERLKSKWSPHDVSGAGELDAILSPDALDQLDPFDAVQLQEVVRVCRRSATLSQAGRTLFRASRRRRKSINDADRLRKYLATFDLSWAQLRGAGEDAG